MKAISESMYAVLMAQGIGPGRRTGIRRLGKMIARSVGTGAAVNVASAPRSREETNLTEHSPTSHDMGEEARPMGMGKSTEAEAPASFQEFGRDASQADRLNNLGDPFHEHNRDGTFRVIVNPNLSAQRSYRPRGAQRRTGTPPSLVLIIGDKA